MSRILKETDLVEGSERLNSSLLSTLVMFCFQIASQGNLHLSKPHCVFPMMLHTRPELCTTVSQPHSSLDTRTHDHIQLGTLKHMHEPETRDSHHLVLNH